MHRASGGICHHFRRDEHDLDDAHVCWNWWNCLELKCLKKVNLILAKRQLDPHLSSKKPIFSIVVNLVKLSYCSSQLHAFKLKSSIYEVISSTRERVYILFQLQWDRVWRTDNMNLSDFQVHEWFLWACGIMLRENGMSEIDLQWIYSSIIIDMMMWHKRARENIIWNQIGIT